MLHLEAEWLSKQNILIADKFWQNQARSQVLRFGGMLKKIFLSTTKCGGHKKDLKVTAPECLTVSVDLARTVDR